MKSKAGVRNRLLKYVVCFPDFNFKANTVATSRKDVYFLFLQILEIEKRPMSNGKL